MQSINRKADPDRVIHVLAAAMQNYPIARLFHLDAYELPNSTTISFRQSKRLVADLLEPLYDADAIFAENRDQEGACVLYVNWCRERSND